jgi:hypothetical protein
VANIRIAQIESHQARHVITDSRRIVSEAHKCLRGVAQVGKAGRLIEMRDEEHAQAANLRDILRGEEHAPSTRKKLHDLDTTLNL